MSRNNVWRLPIGLLAVALLLLSNSVAAFAAPQSQAANAARGVFGEVVGFEANTIIVQTKTGEEARVTTDDDTDFRAPSSDLGDAVDPAVGDRVAIALLEDGVTARSVMVLPSQAQAKARPIEHVTGIVIEADDGSLVLSTGDGRDVGLAFGLGGVPVEVGESVTVAGARDESGELRVRSAQGVDKLIERLRTNIENIEGSVVERGEQVQHVARTRELTEKISRQQIQLLDRVQAAHANQTVAMDKALQNLQAAERNVERAMQRVVDLRGKQERESERLEDGSVRSLPDNIKPSLGDIAEALGITEDELIAILREGRTLAQAAEERGLTVEDLDERVVARIKTRLEKLADDGEINRESVELLLSNIQGNLNSLIKRVFNEERVNADLPVSVEDLADALGTEATRVFAELREGRTPEEIAERVGVSREEFVEKLVEATRKRAETLSDDGTLDTKDVERILERFKTNLEGVVDKAQDRRSTDERRGRDRSSDDERDGDADRDSDVQRPLDDLDLSLDRELLARILGLSIDDLVRLLKEGVTIEEIADRQDVDFNDVIDKLLAPIRDRLASAVEDGTLDSERAAAMIDSARERIIRSLRSMIPTRKTSDEARTSNPNKGENPLYAGIQLSAKDIADVLGIPVDQLQRALASSGGIQALLEELGADPDELVAKLLRVLEERLSGRAAGSEENAEKVRTILATAKRRLLSDLGAKPAVAERQTRTRDARTDSAAIPFDLARVARVLGIDAERLRALLAEGLTIAEIAERAGIPLERITDALTETTGRQTREAIASGRVTEEEARRKVSDAQANARRALQSFRLGDNARDRLADDDRAADQLLTDRERQRRADTTDERQKRIAAAEEERRRRAAEIAAERQTRPTLTDAERQRRATPTDAERQRRPTPTPDARERRATITDAERTRPTPTPTPVARETRTTASTTYAEELRALDARSSDLTREEYNRLLRELQLRYGIATPTPTPTTRTR